MRVLIVASEFNPWIGGIERYVGDMAATLSARAEVGLVVGSGQVVPAHHGYADLGALNLSHPSSAEELRENTRRLRQLATDFKADVVHFASAGLALYAPHLADVAPAFATVHCKDLTRPWQLCPGGDAIPAMQAGLSGCDGIFCVSRFTEAQVRARVPGARTQLLTPGLSLRLRSLPKGWSETRSRGGDRIHVVSAGRVIRRKGHQLLLEIFEHMSHPVRWTVAGDGPSAKDLRARVEQSPLREHVTMTGAVDDLTMWQTIRNADLFALTPVDIRDSRGLDAEGFGLVFIEAAALGVPSIASVYGGCSDAVRDGHTGLLVDPLDPVAAARAVDGLLNRQGWRAELSDNCRRMAREDFCWSDRVATLLTAYNEAKERFSSSSARKEES